MPEFQAVLLMIGRDKTGSGWLTFWGHGDNQVAAFSAAQTFRRLSQMFLFAALGFLCGCQTPKSLFAASGPAWHVQQGQAVWRPQRGLPEFGGDVVLASDDTGRHLIQFDKTPMAILSAQTTSNRWLIQFPQRNQSFSGHGSGWTRFGWLYLPRALEGKPLPKAFKFERKPDGGWRLENSRTGETLEGFLSP